MTAYSTGAAGTDLLRGAAHLLRTPLGVILGMATTLRDYDARFTSEQRVAYLGEVLTAAEELRLAVDGMSLLSRLVSGTLTFNPTVTPLAVLLADAATTLAGVWGADGSMQRRVDDGTARVDGQRLSQALEAVARAFQPGPATVLALSGGQDPALELGPLMPRAPGDDIEAMLRVPLDQAAAADWTGRLTGWSLLLARYLTEGQGAYLSALAVRDGVIFRIDLPGTPS